MRKVRMPGRIVMAAAVVLVAGAAVLITHIKTHAAKPVPPLPGKPPAAEFSSRDTEAEKNAETPAIEAPAGVVQKTVADTTYFILKPGHESVFKGKSGTTMVCTVLDDTKRIGNVVSRAVEEKLVNDEGPREVARAFYAVSEETGDVLLFGKGGQVFVDGKVSGDYEWYAQDGGQKPILVVPGNPTVGMKFDRAGAELQAARSVEVTSMSETVTTPAGTFVNCLKLEETLKLQPESTHVKIYAPRVGLVQDGDFLLVSHRFVNE